MRILTGAGLVLAAALATAAWTKPAAMVPVVAGHLAPRDECASLPGAAAFRAALASAVRRRDADAFAALSANEVQIEIGETGPAGLKRLLRTPEGAGLWSELDRLLPLGCAVQDGEMVLPWFFAQDIGENDNYDRYLVAGANVPLYEARSDRAKVLRLLSWVLVRQLDPASETRPRFTSVRLETGSVAGYVETASLRSQIDYRLGARRIGKSWKVVFLIAGD